MPSESVSTASGSSSVSCAAVTVKLFEVSPALNATFAGTPEYSLASSPAPRVAAIGTVTVVPAAGASASVSVTVADSPSFTDSDAAANDTSIGSYTSVRLMVTVVVEALLPSETSIVTV